MTMQLIHSDGGRSKYFTAEKVGDCVTRAICNATGKDYMEVYDGINEVAKKERRSKCKTGRSSARDGVYKATAKRYIERVLGWEWTPCMQIGSGCKVHLKADELPAGALIVNLSGHFTCVKDGVLYDTFDCSREGTRCVYGYWRAPADALPMKPTANDTMTIWVYDQTGKTIYKGNAGAVKVSAEDGALIIKGRAV